MVGHSSLPLQAATNGGYFSKTLHFRVSGRVRYLSSSGFNVNREDLSYLIAWSLGFSAAVEVLFLIKLPAGGNWMPLSLLFFPLLLFLSKFFGQESLKFRVCCKLFFLPCGGSWLSFGEEDGTQSNFGDLLLNVFWLLDDAERLAFYA